MQLGWPTFVALAVTSVMPHVPSLRTLTQDILHSPLTQGKAYLYRASLSELSLTLLCIPSNSQPSSCGREEVIVPQKCLSGWVPPSEILHITCSSSTPLDCI